MPEQNPTTEQVQAAATVATKHVTRSLKLGWRWTLRRSWHWLYGLIGSVIGAVANAATVMIIDPGSFNLAEGWKKLTTFMFTSAIVSAALYLKQSPLPKFDEERD